MVKKKYKLITRIISISSKKKYNLNCVIMIVFKTKFNYKISCSLIYFKNLTVKLYINCIFNTHIKFCINGILFTI